MTRIALTTLLFIPLLAHADDLGELAAMMQGRFDTHAPGHTAEPADDSRLTDSRQRVTAPTLGDVVFYLQLNQGADLRLYRQRILVFAIDEASGAIVQNAYVLREPGRFVDAVSGDAVLDGLTADDVEPMFAEGCGQVWQREADGFAGYTDPATCRIISGRTGRPRRIEAETRLTATTLSLAERGYDDEMNQLFGTPVGELTTLHRVE